MGDLLLRLMFQVTLHSAIRSHTEQVCNAAVSNAAFSIVDSASNELEMQQ